jgi:hypothetical protein
MNFLASLFSGLLFGAGLILSGMSDPAKVFGFLDVAGLWDPSLALVMAGAIGVALLPFSWARRLERSWLGTPIAFPANARVDRRLVLGSVIFGVGWGLSGICPGPALISLGSGYLPGAIFAVCMFLGMKISEWWPE